MRIKLYFAEEYRDPNIPLEGFSIDMTTNELVEDLKIKISMRY